MSMPVITSWVKQAGVLGAGLALSACVSLAPDYQGAPLPTAAHYPHQEHASREAPALPDWRTYFADPRLQELIAQALDNNRDLRIALLRVEEARAMYGIERSSLFPAIAAQAGGTRSRVPGDLNLTGKPLIGNQYQVGIGWNSWELDFWGRVRSLRDAALEQYLASEAAQRAVRLSLIAQVANAYLELGELDERIALAHQTIASREQSYRIFARRAQVGSTSRLNLTQVETLLIQAQALAAQLEQARAARYNALMLLIGTPSSAPLRLQLPASGALPEVEAGMPSQLLTRRPDVIAAEHRLRAAHFNIGAARAAFFPAITLTGSFGTASADLDRLFVDGSHAWSFTPAISLPLLDGGRRSSNLDLAQARRDLALAGYEKTVQEAFRDVADALSAGVWLKQQLVIAQNALAVQQERARLSTLRYDNGAAPFLDVLDAQRDLLAAEQQLVQVRHAVLASRVSLYAALGGDMPPLPPTARPSADRQQ